MMKKLICPFCGKELERPNHLNYCKNKPHGIDNAELKILYYQYNFGDNVTQDIVHDYTIENYSLPMLKEKYGLSFRAIDFILDYENINKRNISESQKLISVTKIRNTCLKKYGCTNPSQVQEVKDKKSKTFLEHYNVDNIWKTKEYARFTSERWKSYTAEEKNALLNKYKKKYGRISLFENRIQIILSHYGFNLIGQYKFSDYYHKYDFLIRGTKILLEINGDFWHANPTKYKEYDILKFSDNVTYTAKEIWEKDKINIEQAKKHGYKVITIWENEIKTKKETELISMIIDRINC